MKRQLINFTFKSGSGKIVQYSRRNTWMTLLISFFLVAVSTEPDPADGAVPGPAADVQSMC